ncbi:MAG: ABC transporter substrate-binding protein [Nostocaceae cyanobacterium]|nr:ABC transporter substrate-binding protein [Nostocaceae cyanobacterium]
MTDSVARRNPYIIGRPIDEQELFVGREGLFRFIEDNLRQGEQAILLHGQRRIGKSSIIRNIPKFVALDEFLFVPFDLEHHIQDDISTIFLEMTQEIIEHLKLSTNDVKLPTIEELEQEPLVFSSKFLPQIYQEIDGRNLVLLLDEFDVSTNNENSSQILENLFIYLDSILELDRKIFIILFLERQSTDMPNILGRFKDAPIAEIGLLDETNSTRLITEPAKDILKYEPEAIKEIIKLSAGHPYFTQSICFAVFGRAWKLDKWEVTKEDIDASVDKAIELAEAGLAWFWDGLSIWEKIVFAAVAEAQKISQQQSQKSAEDPLKIIQKHGIVLKKTLLTSAKDLVKNGFVDDTEQKIKIEFVQRWLVQRHPLEQEIRKLKKIEKQEINSSYELDNQQPNYTKNTGDTVAETNTSSSYYNNHNQRQGIVLGTLAVAGIIISFFSVGVSQISNSCAPNEEKVLGIFCQSNPQAYISNGDRTLFPITANTNLKKGNIAFKDKKYPQAVTFFKQAVKDNRNQPEPLIYYNNAIAMNKGNPLTLAAIVPAKNNEESTAKEILRGVAQAQNQFNNNNGLNGRLLKVVIANDGNEPKQAQQVANELVKDKELLGVIGHANTEAIKAALIEYQEARLAVISPTNTSAIKSNIFFRTVNSEAMTAKKLAEYASDTLKLKKVVIFSNPDSPYSRSLTTKFTNQFKQSEGEVVQPQIDLTNPKLDVKDIEQEVEKTLRTYHPQAAVLFPDTEDTNVALQIATAIKKQMDLSENPNPQGLNLLGGDSLYSNQTLKSGKNAVEGLTIAVPWFREAPQAQNFAQQAAKQWGGAISWRTATSFDATMAFINSFSKNANRATILQNLKKVNLPGNQTSGYPLQFQQGERQTKPVLVEVQGGKFVLLPSQGKITDKPNTKKN